MRLTIKAPLPQPFNLELCCLYSTKLKKSLVILVVLVVVRMYEIQAYLKAITATPRRSFLFKLMTTDYLILRRKELKLFC